MTKEKETLFFNTTTSEMECIVCGSKIKLEQPFPLSKWIELQDKFMKNHKSCIDKDNVSFGVKHLEHWEIWDSLTKTNKHKLTRIISYTVDNCKQNTRARFIEFLEENMFINDSNKDQFLSRLDEVL